MLIQKHWIILGILWDKDFYRAAAIILEDQNANFGWIFSAYLIVTQHAMDWLNVFLLFWPLSGLWVAFNHVHDSSAEYIINVK